MSSLRTRPPLMQQAGGDGGGGEEEPLQTMKEEPQATGDGSTNYPWYIPDKKEEAWRPGEEADVTSVLDAFNQGFNFNKNLKKERGEEVKDGLDLSERIGTFVLLLVAAWSANVALTQSQDSRAESR